MSPDELRTAMRTLGYRIAIDDLGAGYAGLTSFAQLEPEVVKVDMSLVRVIDRSAVKQKLVRSIIALCTELGIQLVAEGIAEQLGSLVEAVRDESFTASFATSGAPRPVPAAVALALHRTALEALTNVRRHASASRADVVLSFLDPRRIVLDIRDDGQGAATLDGGFGLTGIRERAAQIGGSVRIETSPGAGFALTMELPA